MAEQLTLHGTARWDSPYVFSAFVALKEKGIPFELKLVDTRAGEHRRPPYQVDSLTGRVPVLRHGDFWLAESSAIEEYLEDLFPPPAHPRLYPADVRLRARARMVQAFVRSDLGRLREERSSYILFSGESPTPLTDAGRDDAERLVRIAGRFLTPGARHVAGDFSIADADLALMLQRLAYCGDPCPEPLAEYARRVFQRPSVREWLSHTLWKDR